jgi:hypothetical protein
MINYGVGAECIAFLFSLLLLNKKIPPVYRLGTFYCFSVLVVESCGYYLSEKFKTNHVLFNWANAVWLLFYLAVIRYFINLPQLKKQIPILMAAAAAIWVLNMCLGQGPHKYNSYTSIVGYLLVAYSCMLFYFEFLKRKAVIKLKLEPSFFIVSGLFFFSFLFSFILTIHSYFAYQKLAFNAYKLAFTATLQIANVGFYLLLATGFYLVWRQRNEEKTISDSNYQD